MMTNAEKITSKLQITAIILMTAGSGWSGGNFTQGLPLWNMLLHCIPIALLLAMSLLIFRVQGTYQGAESSPRGAILVVSILAVLGFIASVVLVVLGVTSPDPNSVGVHSPGDWMVVIAIMAGVVLWFATLLVERAQSARVQHEAVA